MPPEWACPSPRRSHDPHSHVSGALRLGWQRLPWEADAWHRAEAQEQSLLGRELMLLKAPGIRPGFMATAVAGRSQGRGVRRKVTAKGWMEAGVSLSHPHCLPGSAGPGAGCSSSRKGAAWGAPSRRRRTGGHFWCANQQLCTEGSQTRDTTPPPNSHPAISLKAVPVKNVTSLTEVLLFLKYVTKYCTVKAFSLLN